MKKQFYLIVLLALAGFANAQTAKAPANQKEALEQTSAQLAPHIPEEIMGDFGAQMQALEASGIVKNAVQVGQKAPDFHLTNAAGKQVSLKKMLKDGPVILTFYRGSWCPFCNVQLAYLQQSLPDFKRYNATLVALSPQLPDSSLTLKERKKLSYEVLTDPSAKVAGDYKVLYKVTPEVQSDLSKMVGFENYYNQDKGYYELPLAATYLIGKDGIVKYAYLDVNWTKRAEPADIVKVLKTL